MTVTTLRQPIMIRRRDDVDESMEIPQHAMYHYSNVLYREIKASLQMWARHNGIKEDF